VIGYQTEYSGMRWGIMAMAEYTNQFTAAAIAAMLFLGGWDGPFLPGWLWLVIKAYALVMVMMWVRWTLPRVRIDQLLDLSWKFLLPVSLLNLVVVAIFLV
ncbi:MAG: NADH-quinone oxidoreductase subunit H, partial [Bacillota bacterium]